MSKKSFMCKMGRWGSSSSVDGGGWLPLQARSSARAPLQARASRIAATDSQFPAGKQPVHRSGTRCKDAPQLASNALAPCAARSFSTTVGSGLTHSQTFCCKGSGRRASQQRPPPWTWLTGLARCPEYDSLKRPRRGLINTLQKCSELALWKGSDLKQWNVCIVDVRFPWGQ